MDDLSFRPFRKDDLSACARFTADAWPVVSALVPGQDVVKLMHAYVELGRLPSTRLEVACVSGKVVGFLFGRINSEYGTTKKLTTLISYLMIGIRAILGKYGRLSRPLTFLRKAVKTGNRVKQHMPKSDAVVVLFVADAKHRGKGIGRALMDRFVSAAKSQGTQTVALHTDQLSSWQFYEKYGFTRWGTFTEILSSHLAGADVKGFIYVLNAANSAVDLENQ